MPSARTYRLSTSERVKSHVGNAPLRRQKKRPSADLHSGATDSFARSGNSSILGRIVKRCSGVWRIAATAAVLAVFLWHGSAHADRKHKVSEGQSLGIIAKRYGVSVTNLAAANKLQKTSNIRVGQVLKVPPKGVIYVYPGQTLGGLARANKVSIKALAQANRIKPTATLRVGQRLVLPGYSAKAKQNQERNKILNGTVTLARPSVKKSFQGRLFNASGKVLPKARAGLAQFLGDRESGKSKPPSERLMRVLAHLADHFNGRTIIVVSAYRAAGDGSSTTSRHATGEAIDLRIDGVPNEVLRDFSLTLSKVGVGYYPRSSFVHVDVRSSSAYWVDWSRPGEPALYLPPGETPESDDTSLSKN